MSHHSKNNFCAERSADVKNRIIKILSALICLALIFTVISLTPTHIRGAESSEVVLFYNDKAWTLARLPVEKIHSIYYVPITFMVQLPDVDVRVNEALKTFIITHGDYFLSFDITSDFAVNHNKERMYLKSGEYHNERYVPVDTVCAYLKLGYEEYKSPSTGATAIRVTDGHQTKPLKEIAEQKFPSLFSSPANQGDTTSPSNTTPSVSTTHTAPLLPERTVYITFENAPGEYTDDILEVLKGSGITATFFVVGEKMAGQADIISKIVACGHTIALQSMNESDGITDAAELIGDIETQNEILYSFIKQKSRIRKSPDVSDETYETLRNVGYYLWKPNITIPASVRNARSAATAAIDGIWKNEIAVISFEENKYTADALKLLLDFIKENRNSCEIRAVCPVFHEDGSGIE